MADPNDDLHNLAMSAAARPLLDKVVAHVRDHCDPAYEDYERLGRGRAERFAFAPGQLEILEDLKARAKAQGLWNFFLPNAETGEGLSNLDYAYIAFELGKNPLASQSLNCAAPDTGNMEVLERVGTPEQKDRWLKPLLAGEIRSAFAMTEPDVASSDARNIGTRAVLDSGEWVINGEKYYISGAGDPRCKIMIVMVKTSPEAEPFRQQSQILVPMDTPGVEVVGPMHVFGHDDAPHGHMQIRFTDVRVPEENILWGEGRGFEISQVRLGPGRIHHCMRSIGAAEKALDLMIHRGLTREAFGKKIIDLGKNMETISRSRIEIDAMRLMVLKAAKAMDVLGNKEARIWVSKIKAMVPEKCCKIIDDAMQVHGATGLSQWSPLSEMYIKQRTLRFADGPDEVHHHVIARAERRDFENSNERQAAARAQTGGGTIFEGP
ncbi:MAG: acyl-CoA dehydrogenase family protein [Pseudodonghicola sp.]